MTVVCGETVIARSTCDEAIHASAYPLAERWLLRFARNDGEGAMLAGSIIKTAVNAAQIKFKDAHSQAAFYRRNCRNIVAIFRENFVTRTNGSPTRRR
jgi:hypothetical protein